MDVANAKQVRLEEANRLIELISSHGRRFFYNQKFNRIARLELIQNGQIRFRDDYTDQLVNIYSQCQWRHFSHGGTLRELIIALRDYIRFGAAEDKDHRIPIGLLSPRPTWSHGDIWGYGDEAVNKLREEAKNLPIIRWKIQSETSS